MLKESKLDLLLGVVFIALSIYSGISSEVAVCIAQLAFGAVFLAKFAIESAVRNSLTRIVKSANNHFTSIEDLQPILDEIAKEIGETNDKISKLQTERKTVTTDT